MEEKNNHIENFRNLLECNSTERNIIENQLFSINDLFRKGFKVESPSRNEMYVHQLMQQMHWNIVSRMKPLDMKLEGAGGVDWHIERIISDGLTTCMREGGFNSMLSGKTGVFHNQTLYGNAMFQVSVNKDSDFVLEFTKYDLTEVYVDTFATSIRTPTNDGAVTRLGLIRKYPTEYVYKKFPELKEKGIQGNIPRDQTKMRKLSQTDNNNIANSGEETEIGYFYDIINECYLVVAGNNMEIIQELKGEDYPFKIKRKGDKFKRLYIPVFCFSFLPSFYGFYDYGIGHISYKIHLLLQEMNNKAIVHGYDNINPIRMVSINQGKEGEFFNNLWTAKEMQRSGEEGYMVNQIEFGGTSGGQVTTFQSNPITTEWERITNFIDKQLKRWGIHIDAFNSPASKTATQIIAETEVSDAFIAQIQENNADEYEFLYEVCLELIKKYGSTKSKCLINTKSKIYYEEIDEEIQLPGITIGMIVEQLRNNDFYVSSNRRSGVIPSNVVEMARISRQMTVTPPGTVAFNRLWSQMASINGHELSIKDLRQPQQSQEQMIPQQDMGKAFVETSDMAETKL